MFTCLVVIGLLSPAAVSAQVGARLTAVRYDTVSATVRLTPSRPVARISRVFDHNTGFAETRMVLPRGVAAELLIRTPIEVVTNQPPDVHFCTPVRRCTAQGVRTIITRLCHSSPTQTVCEERLPASEQTAIFPPGRYIFVVREFTPMSTNVALRLTFLRG
jgi:phage tail protein X